MVTTAVPANVEQSEGCVELFAVRSVETRSLSGQEVRDAMQMHVECSELMGSAAAHRYRPGGFGDNNRPGGAPGGPGGDAAKKA